MIKEDGRFYRVLVMSVKEQRRRAIMLDDNEPEVMPKSLYFLRLLFIDEGRVREGVEDEKVSLWQLPDELNELAFKRQSCQVVITGLKPQGKLLLPILS